MKKILKALPKPLIYAIPCIFCAVILILTVCFRIKADSIGNSLGETMGVSVGKMEGSVRAFYNREKAYAEGKERVINTPDTTVKVGNKIQELNKLEVLVAGIKINDVHSIGNDYASLYLLYSITLTFAKTEMYGLMNAHHL